MLARLRSLNIADRRDVLLVVLVSVLVFAATLAWALTFSNVIGKAFTFTLLIVASLLVAAIPRFTWGRDETRPRARFMVRLGLAMQILGVIITPVGLYYETNPVISVPIGFAAFLSVFFGVFISGFGGNMLAPQRA